MLKCLMVLFKTVAKALLNRIFNLGQGKIFQTSCSAPF
jgi:hypothetical protein